MHNNTPVRWVLRLAVVAAFLALVFAWDAHYLALGERHGFSFLAYKAIQGFFFNAEAVDNASPLLAVMTFVAPATLATAVLAELAGRLRSALAIILFRLRGRGRRRVLVAGTAIDRGLLLRSLPDLHLVAVVASDAEVAAQLRRDLPGVLVTVRMPDAATLRYLGSDNARRVLLFPGDNVEAWDLLESCSQAGRQARSDLPVTLFTDRMSDSGVLARLKEADLDRMLPRVDLHLVDSGILMAQRLLHDNPPHKHPRAATLLSRAPGVVVHGGHRLTLPLLRECLQQCHYHALTNLRLTCVLPDGAAAERCAIEAAMALPGLGMVCDFRCCGESEWFSPAMAGEPGDHVAFVLAESLDDLERRLRAHSRRLKFGPGDGWEPCLVPVFCGEPDRRAIAVMEEHLKSFGFARLKPITCLDRLVEWPALLDEHEQTDFLARTIHNLYQGLDTCTPWPEWRQMAAKDREMNRRSARHLAAKFWALGWELAIDPSKAAGADTTFAAAEIERRISGDPNLDRLFMELEHRRWVADKLLDGFEPLPLHLQGLEPAELKRCKDYLLWHRDIRPFHELDEATKAKDRISYLAPHLLTACPGLVLRRWSGDGSL